MADTPPRTGTAPSFWSSELRQRAQEAREVAVLTRAYWQGVSDAHDRALDQRRPAQRGGNIEVHYLRGFIDGVLDRVNTPIATHDFERERAAMTPSRRGTDDQTPDDTAAPPPSGDGHAPRTRADPGRDGDDDVPRPAQHGSGEEDDDDVVLPGAFLSPAVAPSARPARHLQPLPGSFKAHALPGIGLPEGVDRNTLTQAWDPTQRAELISLNDKVAWMQSELQTSPAALHVMAAVAYALWAYEFPGTLPPSIVLPAENADGTTPNSIAVIAPPYQIAHVTSIGTWSTTWACIQAFPNHPLPKRFVCTIEGPPIPRSGFQTVHRLVEKAIVESVQISDFLTAHGAAGTSDSLEIEYVQPKRNGAKVHLWNILLTPPPVSEDIKSAWRSLIATIRPSAPTVGTFRTVDIPLICSTCGSIRHSTDTCPTISAPEWLGFIPNLLGVAERDLVGPLAPASVEVLDTITALGKSVSSNELLFPERIARIPSAATTDANKRKRTDTDHGPDVEAPPRYSKSRRL